MNLSDLKKIQTADLISMGEDMGLENLGRQSRKDIIYNILRAKAKSGEDIFGEGVLQIIEGEKGGYGFLRDADCSYQPSPIDIYVSQSQIRKSNLRNGDTVFGKIKPPKADNEKYFALLRADTINHEDPAVNKHKILFENLTPIHPNERLRLERGNGSTEDITARIIDLLSPIGKGQRGLIVAPPKAGKTMILQNIAQSIHANNPECDLLVLLIDERPEEVTEMQRMVQGEVFASTFDEDPKRHVQVAEMVIEKAKRLVEHKHDVVILLDSITRLARAYNITKESSGRVLTGGVDAGALQGPKALFGAARNIEEGGSLTIIGTALIETGSKMDDVIYEEFKGTGNMELHLVRKLAEKRIFPAISVNRSSTRHDELLTTSDELAKMWIIRKFINAMNSSDEDESKGTEFLIQHLSMTKTNEEFFESMKK